MVTQKELDSFIQRANELSQIVDEDTDYIGEVVFVHYPEFVEQLIVKLRECVVEKDEDQEWETYLLSIGVTDLNNKEEINEKLDEVERNDPKFQAELEEALKEAIDCIENTPESELVFIGKGDTRAWLQSLLEEDE